MLQHPARGPGRGSIIAGIVTVAVTTILQYKRNVFVKMLHFAVFIILLIYSDFTWPMKKLLHYQLVLYTNSIVFFCFVFTITHYMQLTVRFCFMAKGKITLNVLKIYNTIQYTYSPHRKLKVFKIVKVHNVFESFLLKLHVQYFIWLQAKVPTTSVQKDCGEMCLKDAFAFSMNYSTTLRAIIYWTLTMKCTYGVCTMSTYR